MPPRPVPLAYDDVDEFALAVQQLLPWKLDGAYRDLVVALGVALGYKLPAASPPADDAAA